MGVDSSHEGARMRMRTRYKKIRLFPLRLSGRLEKDYAAPMWTQALTGWYE